jgi:tetratricopeptide (TPR) repeat protein
MDMEHMQFHEKSQLSPAEKHYSFAMAAFKENNYRETLRLLTCAFIEDSAFKPAYELVCQCMEQLSFSDEAKLFREVLGHFDNYEAFYNLGYYYIDIGQNKLAIPFLERALTLSGGSCEVAIELSVAYNSQFQPEKALEVLKRVDLGSDFWAWYQYYWCALLSGEVEGIYEFIKGTKNYFDSALKQENSETAPLYYVLEKLQQCLNRYNTIKQVEPIIKHWHYIQYGASILDYFEESISENVLPVTGGRYASKFGQYSEVKKIICRLRAYTEGIRFLPETIYFLPDRDSEILARVTAQIFNITCKEYCNKRLKEKHIVLAADNRDFNVCPELASIKANQLVFSYNHHWLENSLITPDVCGFMSQMYVFPWQGGALRVNPENSILDKAEKDERPAEEVAKAICEEVCEPDEVFEEILQFYSERKEFLKGGKKGGSKRLSFNTDSPVKGAYLC